MTNEDDEANGKNACGGDGVIPVAIDQISAEHIRSLIDNEVRESRTIEYKQTLPGGSDAHKKEFLADVSSFANAGGGDLIYGVSAADGVPQEVSGLESFNADQDVLRLESTIRDGIKPRILDLRTRVVNDFDEGPVLVLRVPKSWAGPHMVTYGGTSRFFARSSAGKYQMDVDELRSAFALAGDLPEQIRLWRNDQIAKIFANRPSIRRMVDSAQMILHLVPLDSFNDPYRIQAIDLMSSESKSRFQPMYAGPCHSRLNLDGLLTSEIQSNDVGNKKLSYCQVFRSGRVESVRSDLGHAKDGTPRFARQWYEKIILESTAGYLKALSVLDVNPPIVFLLAFIGVKNLRMSLEPGCLDEALPIDRDILVLPDILIEETPRNLPYLLRPAFDAVWNACGLPRSRNYDENGNWVNGNLIDVPMEDNS